MSSSAALFLSVSSLAGPGLTMLKKYGHTNRWRSLTVQKDNLSLLSSPDEDNKCERCECEKNSGVSCDLDFYTHVSLAEQWNHYKQQKTITWETGHRNTWAKFKNSTSDCILSSELTVMKKFIHCCLQLSAFSKREALEVNLHHPLTFVMNFLIKLSIHPTIHCQPY